MKALKAGKATITATNDAGSSAEDTGSKTDNVTVAVNATKAANVDVTGDYTTDDYSNDYVTVTTSKETTDGSTYYEKVNLANAVSVEAGKLYVSTSSAASTTPTTQLTLESAGNGQVPCKKKQMVSIFIRMQHIQAFILLVGGTIRSLKDK